MRTIIEFFFFYIQFDPSRNEVCTFYMCKLGINTFPFPLDGLFFPSKVELGMWMQMCVSGLSTINLIR